MYYKRVSGYYNKATIGEILDKKEVAVDVSEENNVTVKNDGEYAKAYNAVYESLDGLMPSEKVDYEKNLKSIYSAKNMSDQKVGLVYLSEADMKNRTATSKDMRKSFKETTARDILSDMHLNTAVKNSGVDVDPKLLTSFENPSFSNEVKSQDTNYIVDSLKFLSSKEKTPEDKLKYLNDHINNVAKCKDDLLKKGSDADFVKNYSQNVHIASALAGLGQIGALAEKFGIKLDDATLKKCGYLGKMGETAKENLNANAQRISDVTYGLLTDESAKQFSDAFDKNKDLSDELKPNANTYINDVLKDCKAANFDFMKAFMKESVSELGVDPETAFIDANGNVAKIDDLDKVNPDLSPTVIFDEKGNLKTFVDFDDISGKPTTYKDVPVFDLKNNAKTQEACSKFSENLNKNDFFKNSKDEDLTAIKDNLKTLAGKDYKNVNPRELTEKTIDSCKNYINKVKNNPKATESEMNMAKQMGEMYRSMCASIGKLDVDAVLNKDKEKEQTKQTDANKQTEQERQEADLAAQKKLDEDLKKLDDQYAKEKKEREDKYAQEDKKREDDLKAENEDRAKNKKLPKAEDPSLKEQRKKERDEIEKNEQKKLEAAKADLIAKAEKEKLERNKQRDEKKNEQTKEKENKEAEKQKNEKQEQQKTKKQEAEEKTKTAEEKRNQDLKLRQAKEQLAENKLQKDLKDLKDQYDKAKKERENNAKKEDADRKEKLNKENDQRTKEGKVIKEEDPKVQKDLDEKRKQKEDKEAMNYAKAQKKLFDKYEKDKQKREKANKKEDEKWEKEHKKLKEAEQNAEKEEMKTKREEDFKKFKEDTKQKQEEEKKQKEKDEKELKEDKEKVDKELGSDKDLKNKVKESNKRLEDQLKRSEKNNKENDKFFDEIMNELDELDSVPEDMNNIDEEESDKLRNRLADDTRSINGTYVDEKNKNDLSLSVERQNENRNKERNSINLLEEDEGSINRVDSGRDLS